MSIPTHYLQIPMSNNPDRLLLVEPPTDLSVLPDDVQTVLVSVIMAKDKAKGEGEAHSPSAQDAAGLLGVASQITRLCVVGAVNTDGSNRVMFRLADIHQSVGDLRPLMAITIDTRLQIMTGVFKYLTSFRCEI